MEDLEADLRCPVAACKRKPELVYYNKMVSVMCEESTDPGGVYHDVCGPERKTEKGAVNAWKKFILGERAQ